MQGKGSGSRRSPTFRPVENRHLSIRRPPGEGDYNLRRIGEILEGLSPGELDVRLFPEMCDTGYQMDVIGRCGVTWDEDHLSAIKAASARSGTSVLMGLSERRGQDVYNTVAVIGADGRLVHTYRKTHLVSIEPIKEHLYLTPGDRLGRFSLPGLRAGVMTCYELRFPEVARALTLDGVQVLFAPAAWPLVRVDHPTPGSTRRPPIRLAARPGFPHGPGTGAPPPAQS